MRAAALFSAHPHRMEGPGLELGTRVVRGRASVRPGGSVDPEKCRAEGFVPANAAEPSGTTKDARDARDTDRRQRGPTPVMRPVWSGQAASFHQRQEQASPLHTPSDSALAA